MGMMFWTPDAYDYSKAQAQAQIRAERAIINSKRNPNPSARVGKVTLKAGVVKDGVDYRYKNWSDYPLWEQIVMRIILWFKT